MCITRNHWLSSAVIGNYPEKRNTDDKNPDDRIRTNENPDKQKSGQSKIRMNKNPDIVAKERGVLNKKL
jgi:hypothetical protein